MRDGMGWDGGGRYMSSLSHTYYYLFISSLGFRSFSLLYIYLHPDCSLLIQIIVYYFLSSSSSSSSSPHAMHRHRSALYLSPPNATTPSIRQAPDTHSHRQAILISPLPLPLSTQLNVCMYTHPPGRLSAAYVHASHPPLQSATTHTSSETLHLRLSRQSACVLI